VAPGNLARTASVFGSDTTAGFLPFGRIQAGGWDVQSHFWGGTDASDFSLDLNPQPKLTGYFAILALVLDVNPASTSAV
jgi:hypothetical protein